MRKKEYVIYGLHPFFEAIKAGKEIDKVLIQKGLNKENLGKITSVLKETSIPYQFVPVQKLNRVTNKNHQGVIAFVSPVTYQNLENIIPGLYEEGKTPLILILDGITDVRNMGAIARSAECFGVHAIVIPARGSAQINEVAIKTSAGALLRIPLVRSSDLVKTIHFLKNSGIQLSAASEKSESAFYKTDFSKPTVLILGSEESGVQEKFQKLADHILQIPMTGKISSLNVSVAAGIILQEIFRSRNPF